MPSHCLSRFSTSCRTRENVCRVLWTRRLGFQFESRCGGRSVTGVIECRPPRWRIICLARVYLWARACAGYDLDNHLTQGHTLRNREIESLVCTLRVKVDGHALDTGTFDQNLAVVEDFLKWSLDSENRGGRRVLSLAVAGRAAANRGGVPFSSSWRTPHRRELNQGTHGSRKRSRTIAQW
jgi:hypothetical protein